MNTKPTISAANFFRRVKSLYSHWKDSQKEFSDIDAICILNGKNDEESIKIKTTAIYVWLFGYELLDSLLLFTKKTIIFIATPKQISYIEHFKTEKSGIDLDLEILVKDEQDNSGNFEKLKSLLQKDSSSGSVKVGKLIKEKQVSPFANEFETFLQKLSPELVEVGPLIQESLCVKESEELELVKKAAKVAVWFQDKVIMEVENIIDSEVKTRHSDISKKIEAMLENGETKSLETNAKIDKQFADLAYTPIIQSGGQYDLRPQAESTDEYLSYDTILCSVGAKYYEYNCNIVRTLFIDPDSDQKHTYNIAHELQNLVFTKLKPGSTLKSVYDSGYEFVKGKKEDLLSKLPVTFGYGIGLEFREHNLNISAKNEKTIEAGMVFNVTISFSGLKAKNGKEYAIMIADTAIVRQGGSELLTGKIPRKYEEISYSLQGDDNAEEEKKQSTRAPTNQTTTSKRTRMEGQKVEFDEIKRRTHQVTLRQQKLQELEDRFASGNFYGDKAKQKIETEKLTAYRTPNDVPKDIKKTRIHVDMKNDCIMVPIYGQMVPFHVSVIKNVSKQEEDKKIASIRFNFHIPVATASTISFPEINDPNTLYIRELTFKTRDIKNAGDIIKKVKDLQKKAKEKATEEREKNSSFDPEEDPIQLIKGKRPMLQDLKVRPNISGKKTSGNLEAHVNGFRFMTKKNEKIDITFRNIKHAFFQPCDNEMIILLHFNLIKPIMVGKKRSYDVQFYTEAGLQAEDLDMRRRGNDDDEYEQEEREKAQRKKLNEEFAAFTKAVETAARDQIEFDVPYRELAFQGAPFKSSCYLYPTVHCLVNLTETPFFIMTLDEVELAHFERVQYGLRNFDLNFIYKDYAKPVTRICAIPANYLDPIKNWLDKMDLIYSESVVNLDWGKVLGEVRAQVRDDPKNFIENGGWDFLQPSGSEEGDREGLDEDDSAFEVSGTEEEAESESEFSGEEDDDEEEDDEDESSSFEGDDDLEEEGLDWDEMEEMAEKEDRQKEKNKMEKFDKKKKPPMKDTKQQAKKVKK